MMALGGRPERNGAYGGRRWIVLTILAIAGLVLVACGQRDGGEAASDAETEAVAPATVAVDGGSYTNVTPDDLSTMLDDDVPLVNVHVPYEGEIEGTDLFIPYTEIEQQLASLPGDRSARIVLYCMTGSMSDTAARVLVRLGYTDVWNLDGGMVAWRDAGYQIVDTPS